MHEALIQRWGRFREWMDADRAFRAWQERLRDSLRQWEETGQDEGALLAGAPLLVAQNWLADRGGDLSEAEAGYIREGQALEARRQKERERRRRTTILALAGGLIVALVLTFVAFQQRQAARMQAGTLLASQAEAELEQGNADRAVLLALAALENYPYTAQAEHALGQAVTYNRALALHGEHTAAVTGAAWSSDGRRIATSSTDNSVHIWDSSSGELLREINLPEGITGNVYDWALAARWSPGDRYLLTISGDRFLLGSQDYDLILWDAESGERVAVREVQNTTPPSAGGTATTGLHFMTGAGAAFADDGRLATLGGDNSALVWDPMLDDQRLVLNGHTQGVNAIAWSPDFTRLATASEDGTARIWDAENGQELMQLAGHSGAVNQAAWSPDGSLLATAGDDGNVWLWDGVTAEQRASIQVVSSTGSSLLSDRIVWSVAWSPDGSSLATGSGDGSIRVWDVNSGEKTMEMKAHDLFVAFLEWSPVDDRLVSAGADGRARVWNSARDNMVLSLPYGFAQAQWSPDGEQIAVGNSPGSGFTTEVDSVDEGLVAVWDFRTGQPVFETCADKDEKWGWHLVEYSPDGRHVLSRPMLQWPDTTDANKYYMFDSHSGEIVRKLETGKDTLVLYPGWSPDGQLVAGGDYEGTIYFWEVSSGELVDTLSCLAWVHIVQWSPDGSRIAMLCQDYDESVNAIQVIDAETHALLLTIEADSLLDFFDWFRWSPDSTRIAIGGGNDETGQTTNPVYVYDASSGEMLLRIDQHAGQVSGVGWSPDGKRLVSGSTDDTTRIWDAETGAELLTLSTPGDWYVIPDWSPDGQHLLVSIYNLGSRGQSGVWRVWQTTDELVAYGKECCVIRQLTDAERAQFGLP